MFCLLTKYYLELVFYRDGENSNIDKARDKVIVEGFGENKWMTLTQNASKKAKLE